jgi:hypothetical protein
MYIHPIFAGRRIVVHRLLTFSQRISGRPSDHSSPQAIAMFCIGFGFVLVAGGTMLGTG